jgi:two-component system, NtrC family, response regulator HydG
MNEHSDASLLWMHMWKQRSRLPVDTDALAKVEAYGWPGGATEMRDVVDHVAYRATGPALTGRNIPKLPLRARAQKRPGLPEDLPLNLPNLLQELEDAYIDHALRAARGNRRVAAELLGMGRTTLVEKLRRRWKRVAQS